jgi:hypothetical protein
MIRTALLHRDKQQDILALFGTVKNAWRRLRMSRIDYQVFHRALSGYTVTPEQVEIIEFAWEQWKFHYLRTDYPIYANSERFQFPPWDETQMDAQTLWPNADRGDTRLAREEVVVQEVTSGNA